MLPRVAIAVPSGSMVHAGFAIALANLCATSRDVPIQLTSVRSSIIAVARNNAVDEARRFAADYLLFLDSDMEFPPTTLLRLLLHNRDVVGATYVKRVPPFSIIGAALGVQPDPVPRGLLAMERMPTGCLLIKMSVFETLARPYFRFGINPASGDIIGEDFHFCDDVRRAGVRLWCDAELTQEMVHLGERAYRLSDAPQTLDSAATAVAATPSPPDRLVA